MFLFHSLFLIRFRIFVYSFVWTLLRETTHIHGCDNEVAKRRKYAQLTTEKKCASRYCNNISCKKVLLFYAYEHACIQKRTHSTYTRNTRNTRIIIITIIIIIIDNIIIAIITIIAIKSVVINVKPFLYRQFLTFQYRMILRLETFHFYWACVAILSRLLYVWAAAQIGITYVNA